MKKFESLVAQLLGDASPDTTIEEVVDALVALGNTDKVFAWHDDHLGLKVDLSDEFLKSPVSDFGKQKFKSDLKAVLDEAKEIIRLSKRELSEDEIEEIKEDKFSRGEGHDD